jgi:hypothetical protein
VAPLVLDLDGPEQVDVADNVDDLSNGQSDGGGVGVGVPIVLLCSN